MLWTGRCLSFFIGCDVMDKNGADDPAAGLEKGIREFNAGDFYEAHDTWEETWQGVRGPERLFFQGMIQLAIGFYHLTCENYPGAEHLLTRGIEKLEAYLPDHRQVDLADLVIRSAEALEWVVAIRAERGEGYEETLIPQIQRVK